MKILYYGCVAAIALVAGLWLNAGKIEANTPAAAVTYHQQSGCYIHSGARSYASLSMEEKLVTLQKIAASEERKNHR